MGIQPAKLKVGLGTGHEEGTELRQRIEPSETDIPAIHPGCSHHVLSRLLFVYMMINYHADPIGYAA